jgi:predicted lipoprotein with Yx(FWY)xxD motif
MEATMTRHTHSSELSVPTHPSHVSRRARRVAGVAVAAAALLLAAACGSSSAGTTASSQPAGVHVASTDLGKTVVGDNGRTLYLLTSDKKGSTTCTGGCLQLWPPVTVAAGAPKATGVDGALGTLARGGSKQLTIAGHPVYLYAADTAAGDISGQGIKSYGGTWWAVSPSGTAITSKSGSSGSGSTGGGVGGY